MDHAGRPDFSRSVHQNIVVKANNSRVQDEDDDFKSVLIAKVQDYLNGIYDDDE